MKIRLAVREDIPALLRLLEQVLRVHHAGRPDIFRPNTTKYSRQELTELLEQKSSPIFVAEEGEVLGYAFCQLQEISGHSLFQDRKSLYLDDLCVDEAHRGKGLGRALLEYVTDYAQKEGCHSVTLNVWALNPGAEKFYEACGFQPFKYAMERKLSSC